MKRRDFLKHRLGRYCCRCSSEVWEDMKNFWTIQHLHLSNMIWLLLWAEILMQCLIWEYRSLEEWVHLLRKDRKC